MNDDARSSFPKVSGSNLNGLRFNLPDDFKSSLNIVVIAFKRQHTDLIEGWTSHLEDLVRTNPELKYYELPVLSASYSPFRWWIDGGMRAGIIDNEARERTITVYLNKRAFRKQLEIPDENTIYLFLVEKNGKIVWRAEGEFTKEKLQSMESIVKKASDR